MELGTVQQRSELNRYGYQNGICVVIGRWRFGVRIFAVANYFWPDVEHSEQSQASMQHSSELGIILFRPRSVENDFNAVSRSRSETRLFKQQNSHHTWNVHQWWAVAVPPHHTGLQCLFCERRRFKFDKSRFYFMHGNYLSIILRICSNFLNLRQLVDRRYSQNVNSQHLLLCECR